MTNIDKHFDPDVYVERDRYREALEYLARWSMPDERDDQTEGAAMRTFAQDILAGREPTTADYAVSGGRTP